MALKTKHYAPRDLETMRKMAEREVVRSANDDITKDEILEIAKSLSYDWAALANQVMPKVEQVFKKDKQMKRRKLQEVSHLKSFKYIDIQDTE